MILIAVLRNSWPFYSDSQESALRRRHPPQVLMIGRTLLCLAVSLFARLSVATRSIFLALSASVLHSPGSSCLSLSLSLSLSCSLSLSVTGPLVSPCVSAHVRVCVFTRPYLCAAQPLLLPPAVISLLFAYFCPLHLMILIPLL